MYVYKAKKRQVLVGDFNARVRKSNDMDDVIGMFSENTINTNITD